jgi:hypothetical protein
LESLYYLPWKLLKSLRDSESGGLDSTDGASRDSSPMDMKLTRSNDTLRMESDSTDGSRRNCSHKDKEPASSNNRNHADGMRKGFP